MGGSIVSPVLVGCETEVAAMDQALKRAPAGEPVTLVATGDSVAAAAASEAKSLSTAADVDDGPVRALLSGGPA